MYMYTSIDKTKTYILWIDSEIQILTEWEATTDYAIGNFIQNHEFHNLTDVKKNLSIKDWEDLIAKIFEAI